MNLSRMHPEPVRHTITGTQVPSTARCPGTVDRHECRPEFGVRDTLRYAGHVRPTTEGFGRRKMTSTHESGNEPPGLCHVISILLAEFFDEHLFFLRRPDREHHQHDQAP